MCHYLSYNPAREKTRAPTKSKRRIWTTWALSVLDECNIFHFLTLFWSAMCGYRNNFIWHAGWACSLAAFLHGDKLRCEEKVQEIHEACRPHCLRPDQENNNATVPGVKLMLPTHSLPQDLSEMRFSFHLSTSISIPACLVVSAPADNIQHQHVPWLRSPYTRLLGRLI